MIHLKTWQPLNTNRKNAAGFLLMLPEQTALLLPAGLCLLSCSFPSANIELTHVLPTAARTVWRQPNFVTLPNFALQVFVSFGRNWRNIPLHIDLPASSSRVKFFSGISGVLTTFHHIPFCSCLCHHQCLKIHYTPMQEQNTLSYSHLPQETLLWQHSETRVNSDREPSLSDPARCCFWFVAPLLISLCCAHRSA